MAGEVGSFNVAVLLRGKNELSPVLKEASGDVRAFGDRFKDAFGPGTLLLLGAFATGLFAAKKAISDLVGGAFTFDASMEKAELGLTAMTQAFNTMNGAAVPFAAANASARQQLEGVKVIALETASQLTDVVRIYETVYPAAVQAGFKDDQILRFTKAVSNMAGTMNMAGTTVARQIDMILAGHARFGQIGILFKNAGIDNETIQRWRAAGTVFENMMKFLDPFEEMGPRLARTWTGALANLADAANQLLGKGFLGLFEKAKSAVIGIFDSLVTIKGGSLIFSPEALAGVTAISDSLSKLVEPVKELVIQGGGFVLVLLKIAAAVASFSAPFLSALASILGFLTPLIDKWGGLVLGLWAGSKALAAFQLGLQLAQGTAAVQALSVAWNALVVGIQLSTAAIGGFSTALLATGIGAVIVALGIAASKFKGLWDELDREKSEADAAQRGALQTTVDAIDHLSSKVADKELLGQLQKLREEATKPAPESSWWMKLLEALPQVKSAAAMEGPERAKAAAPPPAGVDPRLKEIADEAKRRGAFADMTPTPKPADVDIVRKFREEAEKLRATMHQLGQEGFTAEQIRNADDYRLAVEKLNAELLKHGPEEEKAAIRDVIKARGELYSAQQVDIERRITEQRKGWAQERVQMARDESRELKEGAVLEIATLQDTAQKEVDAQQRRLDLSREHGRARIQLEEDVVARIKLIRDKEADDVEKLRRRELVALADEAAETQAAVFRAAGQEGLAGIVELTASYEKGLKPIRELLSSGVLSPEQADTKAKLLRERVNAQLAPLVAEQSARNAVMRGDWQGMWDALSSIAQRGVEGMRNTLRSGAALLLNLRADAAAGIVAGIAEIQASVATTAESVRNATVSLFGETMHAADDLFFNVLSGRLSSIKDVWHQFTDSLLRIFSDFLTTMLARWVATQLGMEQTSYLGKLGGSLGGLLGAASRGQSGQTGAPLVDLTTRYSGTQGNVTLPQTNQYGQTQGGAPAGSFGAIGGGALLGLGVGSAFGQIGGGRYNMAGAQIGGILGGAAAGAIWGSEAGPYGAIVGAIVGLIVGAIASPNTESHVAGAIADMLGKTIGSTEAQQSARSAYEKQLGQVFDIFKLASPDTAGALLKSYNESVLGLLRGATFDVHAGSGDDLAKDMQYLIGTLIPRLALMQGFGQKNVFPTGDEAFAGIRIHGLPGGGRVTGAGKQGGGNPQEQLEPAISDLYDPEAPIPKMLSGLGVTAEAIEALARRINVEDPQKFLTYLQGFVEVLVRSKKLVEEMSQSPAAVVAGIRADQAKTQAQQFAEAAVSLKDMAGAVDLFTGQEKVDRAKAVLDAVEQFWQQQKAAIAALLKLSDDFLASITAARKQGSELLLTPEQLAAKRSAAIAGSFGAISAASTPEELTRLGNEARENILGAMRDIADQWKALAAARDSFHSSVLAILADVEAAGLSPAELTARNQAVAAAGVANILGSSTDQEAVQNAERARDAIGALLKELLSFVDQLSKMAPGWAALQKGFGESALELGTSLPGSSNPIQGFLNAGFQAQQDIAAAATKSGQEQIDAIRSVQDAAVTARQQELALLQQIATNERDLHKSFSDQRAEIDYSLINDPTGVAQQKNLLERLRARESALQNAVDPSEVASITSEIQSLVSRYLGLFSEDDPNRKAAAAYAKEILDREEQVAKEAYARMKEQIDAGAGVWKNAVDSGSKLTTEALAGAKSAIDGLKETLKAIDEAIGTKLAGSMAELNKQLVILDMQLALIGTLVMVRINGFINAILSTDSGLPAVVEHMREQFTNAGTAAGLVITSSNNTSLSLDRVASSADAVKGAFDRLVARLDSVAGGSGSNSGAGDGSLVASFANGARRNPFVLTRMTGV